MADAKLDRLESRPVTTVTKPPPMILSIVTVVALVGALVLGAATLAIVSDNSSQLDDLKKAGSSSKASGDAAYKEMGIHMASLGAGNVCKGKKPTHSDTAGTNNYFKNVQCMENGVFNSLEQAGANVTAGYVGGLNATGGGREPIYTSFWEAGLCPVNVHWHLGAEHLSVGEYDASGFGPGSTGHRKLLAGGAVREGFECHKYTSSDKKYTAPYEWKHCKDMHVGQTYEVHWPHSAAGACGTPNQFQTPFYDGVFCMPNVITLSPLNVHQKVGVHGQIFTIVNDENYYYPDMIRGMIVDGDMGKDVAKYTGSTTGTSRDNTICSRYTPITWQVDRKCHLISASSFDKMCADMKAQRDDMSDDLHAHGSRELVSNQYAANNLRDDGFDSAQIGR